MKTSGLAPLGLALLLSACTDPTPRIAELSIGNQPGAVVVPASAAGQLSAIREQVERHYRTAWNEFNLADRRSDISKVNQVASTYQLQVTFDTFRALDLAHYYSQLTGGAYDLTLLPALEAWGLAGPIPDREPDEAEREALRELISPNHLQFAEQGAVAILKPGTRIAPESLPYAYGVDLALVELRRQEFSAALLTWERFTRALGRPSEQTPWRQSIRNPFAPGVLGDIVLESNAALAVIGLRDRTVTIGDKRYAGILDPRTVKPAEGVALVAVRGPTCIMANALAHALIVLGLEDGKAILNEFPECEVLLVPDRQPIEAWATEGWIAGFSRSADFVGSLHRWTRPERVVEPNEPAAEDEAELAAP